MINEGLIVNDKAAKVKSQMVNSVRQLGACTPDELERAVFTALTGRERDEIDWKIEDNQAGYYTWIRSFDRLIEELIKDGYILADSLGTLRPTETEPISNWS